MNDGVMKGGMIDGEKRRRVNVADVCLNMLMSMNAMCLSSISQHFSFFIYFHHKRPEDQCKCQRIILQSFHTIWCGSRTDPFSFPRALGHRIFQIIGSEHQHSSNQLGIYHGEEPGHQQDISQTNLPDKRVHANKIEGI